MDEMDLYILLAVSNVTLYRQQTSWEEVMFHVFFPILSCPILIVSFSIVTFFLIRSVHTAWYRCVIISRQRPRLALSAEKARHQAANHKFGDDQQQSYFNEPKFDIVSGLLDMNLNVLISHSIFYYLSADEIVDVVSTCTKWLSVLRGNAWKHRYSTKAKKSAAIERMYRKREALLDDVYFPVMTNMERENLLCWQACIDYDMLTDRADVGLEGETVTVVVGDQLIALVDNETHLARGLSVVLVYDKWTLRMTNAITFGGTIDKLMLPDDGGLVIYGKTERDTLIVWDLATSSLKLRKKNDGAAVFENFTRESNLLIYTTQHWAFGIVVTVYRINADEDDCFELIMHESLDVGYFVRHVLIVNGLDFIGVLAFNNNLGNMCCCQIRSKRDFSLVRKISSASLLERMFHGGEVRVEDAVLLSDSFLIVTNERRESIEVRSLDKDWHLIHVFARGTNVSASSFNMRWIRDFALLPGLLTARDDCARVAVWKLPNDFVERCHKRLIRANAVWGRTADIVGWTPVSHVINASTSRTVTVIDHYGIAQYGFDSVSKKMIVRMFNSTF